MSKRAGKHTSELPCGRHGRTPAEVAEDERQRLIDAVPMVVRASGFAALTVEDIAGRAGVSRRSFYENFRDAEDCFVASYRQHADDVLGAVAEAAATADGWQERTRLALTALLQYLAQRPDVAHMAVIEVLAAGPAALAERDRAVAALRALIGDEVRAVAPDPGPRLFVDVIAGGILQLICARVLVGAGEHLEQLLPTIMYMVLVAPHGPAGAATRAGLRPAAVALD